jgi:hypothetical protein
VVGGEAVSDYGYTRPEFQLELEAVERGDAAAPRRLLSWYDGVMYNLGQVSALRAALSRATAEKVEAEVRAEEAERRIDVLERELYAARSKREENEE